MNNGVPKVAVLYAEGTITDGWSDDGFSVGGNEIADRIREIRRDPQYKALVVRVNSPGGSVSGSDTILLEIKRAREDGLPVVVSMGASCCLRGILDFNGMRSCLCRQANDYRINWRIWNSAQCRGLGRSVWSPMGTPSRHRTLRT